MKSSVARTSCQLARIDAACAQIEERDDTTSADARADCTAYRRRKRMLRVLARRSLHHLLSIQGARPSPG